jgi:hypothetical protein
MNPDLAASLAQFGTAGLIGWMWLTERRAAAQRERQLSEAHDRLMQERKTFELLLAAIHDNTRVLTALEVGQRTLSTYLSQRHRTNEPFAQAKEPAA